MQKLFTAIILILLAMPAALAESTRFAPVDVFIRADSRVLAAYQIELVYDPAEVKLVGLEGGDGVFQKPPYYDPKGLSIGRIIIASFTTDKNVAAGRIRVARIHIAYSGDEKPRLGAELAAVADDKGEKIKAEVELVFGQGESQ